MSTEHKTKPFKYSHKCHNPLCGIEYGTNSKASKTCSDKCRQALSRSKKQSQDTKRLYRFETSPFAHSLARQCIRAGTVQVVLKDAELLAELHQIFKLASRADGYGQTKNYAIAHLSPVKGLHAIGTLHPKNLVVSDRAANAEHRNTLPASGIGHSILRCHLESRWQLSSEVSPSSAIKVLVQYLGEAFCQQLAVKLKLQPATRAKYLEQLTPHLDHEAVKAAGPLDDISTPNLGKLVALVTGKKAGSFSADTFGINQIEVFLSECQRLSKYYPHLEGVHADYSTRRETFINTVISAKYTTTFCDGEKADAAKVKLAAMVQDMFDVFHKTTPLEGSSHELGTKVSHSFNQESMLPNETTSCLVTLPECSAFTQADLAELEALEQAAGMHSYLADEDVPEFSEAELEAAFRGQRHKHTSQTAFARFLSG